MSGEGGRTGGPEEQLDGDESTNTNYERDELKIECLSLETRRYPFICVMVPAGRTRWLRSVSFPCVPTRYRTRPLANVSG